KSHALLRINALDPGHGRAVCVENAFHRIAVNLGNLAVFDPVENGECAAASRVEIVAVIVRKRASVAVEAALSTRTNLADVIEATHDVLPFDLGDRIADELRSRSSDLRAEIRGGGDGSDGAVDDARLLCETGGCGKEDCQKDRRGSH